MSVSVYGAFSGRYRTKLVRRQAGIETALLSGDCLWLLLAGGLAVGGLGIVLMPSGLVLDHLVGETT